MSERAFLIDRLEKWRADPSNGLNENGRTRRLLKEAAAALRDPAPSARQYYYRVNKCDAPSPDHVSCICWHDEGAGPLKDEPEAIKSWRDKPAQSAASTVEPVASRDILAKLTAHVVDIDERPVYDTTPDGGTVWLRVIIDDVKAAKGLLAAPTTSPEPDAVRKAAQAVIDRWETPAWKDAPATSVYINALKSALSRPAHGGWSFDMEAAPKDRDLILAYDEIAAEGYFNGENETWWLANTAEHDFDPSRPIYPYAWREMPKAPPRKERVTSQPDTGVKAALSAPVAGEVTEEMVTAAMRAFEPCAMRLLRYPEKDRWHLNDVRGMREAIKAALSLARNQGQGGGPR